MVCSFLKDTPRCALKSMHDTAGQGKEHAKCLLQQPSTDSLPEVEIVRVCLPHLPDFCLVHCCMYQHMTNLGLSWGMLQKKHLKYRT